MKNAHPLVFQQKLMVGRRRCERIERVRPRPVFRVRESRILAHAVLGSLSISTETAPSSCETRASSTPRAAASVVPRTELQFPKAPCSPPSACPERSPDIKLSFAAEAPVIDRILVETPRRMNRPIVQLHADHVFQRHAAYFFIGNAELHHVPQIEHDSAVGCSRAF